LDKEIDAMSCAKANEHPRHEELVRTLSADLTPVRRLRRPGVRALLWLGVVIVVGVVLAFFSDVSGVTQRLTAAPDMWLAVVGSVLTAALAAVAASELSFPDRSPRWVLLPMPAAFLWIAASGLGCLRTWLVPGTREASPGEATVCLLFILCLSIPLSTLLFRMLQRAYSLRPGLTGLMGGLAVAGASATVLNLFHPYDAAATDLVVHILAVAIVVVANWAHAGRYLVVSPSIRRRGNHGRTKSPQVDS
jgi:hypothetical protein